MIGQVVVVGVDVGIFSTLSSAELYDPSTGSWTLTGALNVARSSHTDTLLRNGQVLVAGGFNGIVSNALSSAELYDPGTGSGTVTGPMSTARRLHPPPPPANRPGRGPPGAHR